MSFRQWMMPLCALFAVFSAAPASAGSLSGEDVQIVARALGFLDPSPDGGVIAVVYAGTEAKADADAIVAAFGSGQRSGAGVATARAVDSAALGDANGYIAIIVAAATPPERAMAAARLRHIPCITGNTDLIAAGHCVMSVKSEPNVTITVNLAAAQAAGLTFASAFRMLIHEI
jgi:hypothetical protein